MALYEVAHLFGTLIAETILASVHVRARKQAGHMGASDLIKALQNTLRGGGRPHTGNARGVRGMLASTVGGYIAGRLRTKWVGVHTHEVFFRDTAHGLLAWGFATVLSAAFLAAAASNIAGGASAVQSAGSGGPVDYYVDTLLRPNPTASPNTSDLEAIRHEIARILTTALRNGDVPAPDRTYVAQVVAARTGLSQADADKRVSDVINQAKTDLDNARKAAAKLSLWLTASLLMGAFCASLAATEGGHVRDNWNPGFTDR